MAAQTWSAAEQSNAQRVYLTKVYEGYQNATDVLGEFESFQVDPINYKGLQVPFEVSPNPSLGYGLGEGGAFPTAGASNMDNFVVTYVALFNGLNETYAALLNNNQETSEDMLRFEAKSNAKQFASWLNTYASAGNSTQALATISANYSGGTPTVVTTNGTTDSIGNSNLVIGGYYTFWNAAGTTQRTGGVGAGPFQLASKTASTCTFGANLPTDIVDTDIICPEVGTTDASYGLYGLPFINDASGTYFSKARATYGGLSSYEKTSAGTLTAGMLSETYFSIVQRGGYFNGGNTNLLPRLEMWTNAGNAQSYYSLSLSSGAVVGGIHQLNHVGDKKPSIDFGGNSINFTWFGAPLKVGNKLPGDQIFFQNMSMMRKAVLKQAGNIAQGMPASDYLQGVNSDGNYTTNRLKFMDFWGQFYSPEPFRLGKISGLTLVAPTQKATNVLSA
jgi:hypothetical protein